MTSDHSHQPRKLFYGWRVLAAAAIMRVLGGGFHVFGFSIFFLPLLRDLGLSRAAGSLVFSLARAEGAVEGPVVGYLLDRFGPRLIMSIGILIVAAGYLLLSTVNSYLSLLLVYLGLISIAYGSTFMHSPIVLANNWFDYRRAFAMSIISASVAVGGAVLTPLLALVVHSQGWRFGAVMIGVIFLVIGFPLTRLIRNNPESLGQAPFHQGAGAGTTGKTTPHNTSDSSARDFSVRRGMRTSAFWILTVGTLLRLAGFSTVMVHFVPILVWKGLDEPAAAYYLSLLALLGIPTHIFMGWLGDRWSRPRVMSLGMASGTVGLIILLYGEGLMLFLFLLLFVAVEAIFSVTWATLGDFFGRRRFATLRGFVIMFTMVGPIIGPVYAGRVYDVAQSYTLPLQFSIIGFALSSLAFWLVRRPEA